MIVASSGDSGVRVRLFVVISCGLGDDELTADFEFNFQNSQELIKPVVSRGFTP